MNEELKKFLKEKGLSDDEIKKFNDALGDKKVMFDDENFVPLSRVKAKNKEIDKLNEIIETNEKELKKLKDSISDDDTKEKITQMEKENETLKTQLEQTKIDTAIELTFSDLSESKRKAAIALLDKDKIKLVDGEVIGIKDQNESLRSNEDNTFIFGSGEDTGNPPDTGGKGNFGKGGGTKGSTTDFFNTIKENQAKRS